MTWASKSANVTWARSIGPASLRKLAAYEDLGELGLYIALRGIWMPMVDPGHGE
jgi:hypothetical protein